MANVLFVSGDPAFGAQFTQTAPAGYSYLQANYVPTAIGQTQAGKYDAVFVFYHGNVTETDPFNVPQFISQIQNTTGFTNTPVLLVVPQDAQAQAQEWVNQFGVDGFVVWEGFFSTDFWSEARNALANFNIRAA